MLRFASPVLRILIVCYDVMVVAGFDSNQQFVTVIFIMHTNVNQQKEHEKAREVLKTVSTDYSNDSILGAKCGELLPEPQIVQPKELTTLVLILVPSNVTYKVETSLVLTVDSLINIVEGELGIERSSCVLIHKGLELVDPLDIKSKPLENNSVVYIVPSNNTCESQLITISLQRGRTLSHILQFNINDKVSRITAVVASQFGVPAEHQTLTYCGGKLPNKTLRELHIVNKSCVRLVVSPEYKKQMSKSYMFANPKPEEKMEEHLPQIEELAKDVQSIDDVDDEILKGHQEQQQVQEVVSADEDFFEGYQLKKKRTTYSSTQKSRQENSTDEKFSKSERPRFEQKEEETRELKLGLIEVKQVNSVYNPDEQDLDFQMEQMTSSAKCRNSDKVTTEWDEITEVEETSITIKIDNQMQ